MSSSGSHQHHSVPLDHLLDTAFCSRVHGQKTEVGQERRNNKFPIAVCSALTSAFLTTQKAEGLLPTPQTKTSEPILKSSPSTHESPQPFWEANSTGIQAAHIAKSRIGLRVQQRVCTPHGADTEAEQAALQRQVCAARELAAPQLTRF